MNLSDKKVLLEVLPENLPAFLQTRRWFRNKSAVMTHVTVHEDYGCRRDAAWLLLLFVEVRYETGPSETYFLPVVARHVLEGETVPGEMICSLPGNTGTDVLLEGFAHPVFQLWLAECLAGSVCVEQAGIRLVFETPSSLAAMRDLGPADFKVMTAEQSNSSVIIGEKYILKLFRKIDEGVSAEVEMLDFLNRRDFPSVPFLRAHWCRVKDGVPITLGMMQDFVTNRGDGWAYVLEQAAGRKKTLGKEIQDLGRQTALLHRALAAAGGGPDFKPEPLTPEDLERWIADFLALITTAFHSWRSSLEAGRIPAGDGDNPEDLEKALRQYAGDIRGLCPDGFRKIRFHGDFHLGQTLKTAHGWILFDFEGEPLRSLSERKRKHCALKDAAGMLRSFSYAAHVLVRQGTMKAAEKSSPGRMALEKTLRRSFLEGYWGTFREGDSGLFPQPGPETEALLGFFELEKAVYEMNYELNNRPDWLEVPLKGIRTLLLERQVHP